MKLLLKVVIILFLVVLLLRLITYNTEITETIQTKKTIQNKDIEDKKNNINAEKLIKEFVDNEVKANKKYKDKIISITGEVTNISVVLGRTTISLDGGFLHTITCKFDNKNEIDKIANINKTDIVNIEGKVKGYGFLTVDVDNCKFK